MSAGCVGGLCLRALRDLRDLSGRPLSGYRWLDNRIETDKRNAYSPLPDKPCGQQNRPKYPPDNKRMTPFCIPNCNIHISYVGATNLVARFPATDQALWPTKPTQTLVPQQKNDAILHTKLQHTHKLCRGDQSGRPLSCRQPAAVKQACPIRAGGTPPPYIHTVSILLPKKGAKSGHFPSI